MNPEYHPNFGAEPSENIGSAPESTPKAASRAEKELLEFFDRLKSEDLTRLAQELNQGQTAVGEKNETVYEAEGLIEEEEDQTIYDADEVGAKRLPPPLPSQAFKGERRLPPPLPAEAKPVSTVPQAEPNLKDVSGEIEHRVKPEPEIKPEAKVVLSPELAASIQTMQSMERTRTGGLDSRDFSPEELDFFEKGQKMEELHAQGLVDTKIDISKSGLVERYDAPIDDKVLKSFLERNELPPEHLKRIDAEIDKIQEKGAKKFRRLEELRNYFRSKGVDADVLAENATVSKWAKMKLGARLAVSSEFRTSWREFQELTSDTGNMIQEVNDLEWLKKDPKGYAEHQADKLVKMTLLRHQVTAGPFGGGGVLPPPR